MAFDELVARLRTGEDVGESLFDELQAEYDIALEGSREAITARDAELEARAAEILALKAANHDLLLSLPVGDELEEDEENEENEDSEEIGIDDLFETKRV